MFSASVKGSGFFQHGPARLCRLKPLQHLSLPHDLIGKKKKCCNGNGLLTMSIAYIITIISSALTGARY